MNRFRTKKRAAREANEAAGRASNDSDTPQIQIPKSSMTFKRGKKNVPTTEPKIELDLSTALPSSDDFRTSLLMSGLSARFSMLREQDDPKSKIGKASDDSVLLPRRQSRLDTFTFTPNGLSDIAEVASIRGSNQFFRPPFARAGNTNSYHSTDGYGTDDDSMHAGSIMGRSKPGEGNNLFGGRQKVYHIPLKAVGDGSSKAVGMGGRARYDDDISQSAFQRFKDRERQQREDDEEQARLVEDAASVTRSNSPPFSGYNRNRETSSTTSSGPTNTRTSTAATSITSQGNSANASNTSTAPSAMSAHGGERSAAPISGMERTVTKTRRLYETGLEKNLHEQQYSAMSRIDSLTRQQNIRSQTPPLTLRSPSSVSNLSDRFERHEISAKQSLASLRAVSPPPSASILGAFEFGVISASSSGAQLPFVDPPLSPPMSEGDDTLSSNLPIDAKDKGKATALGAFNKPAQPYDDMKYSERQMQMKAGRDIPQTSRPFQPQPLSNAGRNRAESDTTTSSSRSRSSSAKRQPFVPRKRIVEMRSPDSKIPLQSLPNSAASHDRPERALNFMIDNQTQYRKPTDIRIAEETPTIETPLQRPPESQHPANRPTLKVEAESIQGEAAPDLPNPSILLSQVDPRKASVDVDSPTLPALTGLSGMVRQHMRSDSNASSYFGAPSPALTNQYPQDSGNPWGLEDWKHDQADEQHSSSRKQKGLNDFSAVPPLLLVESLNVEPAMDEEAARPPPLSIRSPNIEPHRTGEVEKPVYEEDALAHHKREGSSQTQKESESFANELAERRKRVQENLKSFAESDSRSNSPAPDLDWVKEVGKMKSKPLGILKAKSSRESIVGNVQVKSRRILGLGNTTASSSPSPNKQAFDDDMWQKEEEEMLRGLSKSPNVSTQIKDFRRARREERQASDKKLVKESDGERSESEVQHAARQRKFSEEKQPRVANQMRNGCEKQEADERVVRKTSQESKDSTSSSGRSRASSRAARDRSSSAASGRSKSRNGTYRDDLAKAMAEGLSSSTQANYDEALTSRLPLRSPITPGMASQTTIMPSPIYDPSTRSRSNSRPPPLKQAESYFNHKHNLHPLQTSDNMPIGSSPRPSPITPFSLNSTPSLTPNGSGANTPITQVQSFQTQGRAPVRKKTVNKADISEPTLVSKTSQFETVNLPPGASLKNGIESAPPVPPINPRRRQTRIQTMVGVFSGAKSSESVPTMPPYSNMRLKGEDYSTFSGDEGDVKKPRKLRKSSSEGGNLNSRARQLASAQPSPALPGSEQGGMF